MRQTVLVRCPNINSHPAFVNNTFVMHQHAGSDVVGMIVLDLEVIDLNRGFEQLVLDFFYNNVFSVDEDEDVTRAEVRRVRSAPSSLTAAQRASTPTDASSE